MRFGLASDLHFEFHQDGGRSLVSGLTTDARILVVAGDLASASCLWVSLVLLLAKYQHVIFVFGNHEFYGSSFQMVRQSLNKLKYRLPKMRKQGYELGELHLLDNSFTEVEGQRFVGTTLWFRPEPDIYVKHHLLNDFHEIKGATQRIYKENQKAIEFLWETIKPTDVVVTHHLPNAASIHPRWAESEYNCFYLCEMGDLISQRKPKLWLHGHTHDSVDYRLHDTRIVCNPFGYAGHETNPSFDSKLIIEP